MERDARVPVKYPPFEDLIPHAPPMVLLDELVDWEPGRATCTLDVQPDAPFVQEGVIDSLVTIEYMAQAVAACLGYEAFHGGEGVRVGMIIACKKFDLHTSDIPVGASLTIEVSRIRGNEMLSHFDGDVSDASGRKIASGVLTLFHAEKPPE